MVWHHRLGLISLVSLVGCSSGGAEGSSTGGVTATLTLTASSGEAETSNNTSNSGDGDGDSGGPCTEGEQQCGPNGHEVCEQGSWQPDPCPENSYCDEQTGTCEACACEPGELGACVDDYNIEVCAEDCSGFASQPCEEGVCIDGECLPLLCVPGASECIDDDSYHICDDVGMSWGSPIDCPPEEACLGGECLDVCEQAAQIKSNIGCEFWAVDMENYPPQDIATYAVAISNPSFDTPASVSIWDRNGGAEQLLIQDSVPPRQVEVYNLSGAHDAYSSYYNGEDAGFHGSGIGEGRAFRVSTDQPVVATQFNPIGGAGGFTTDASLLLPTATLGTDYLALAWNRGFGSGSSVNIVATEDNTTVTLTLTVDTVPGLFGFPAISAGVPTEFVIDRYDYIQVSAFGGQISGSQIDSDKPVAVFGGHTCAGVPNHLAGYCDHVEEQLFPLETWGRDYIASRNPERDSDIMRWRILAAQDNTSISLSPPSNNLGAVFELDAGELAEFDQFEDVVVSASDPILVAGYMHGCTATGLFPPVCLGDPYMTLMVPNDQFQSDYVFLVDSSYDEDFAKLVRPAGVPVTVDCLGVVPEDRWTQIADSEWEWAAIDMNPGEGACAPGTNAASAAQGFGIIVGGQSEAASYAYPGGLALAPINPQ